MEYYVCPSCKTENEDYVKYCKKCGTWLLSESFPAKKASKKKSRFGLWVVVIIIALIGFGIYGMLINPPSVENIPVTDLGPQSEPGTSTSQIGMSRSNATPLGQELVGKLEQYSLIGATEKENFEVGITVVETVRGPDAWVKIKATNQFNQVPDDGYEYMLVKVKIRVVHSDHEDVQFSANNQTFTLVSSSGADYKSRALVINDPIDIRLYAGAESEGWTVFQVKQDDLAPLIAIARDQRGRGGAWFKTS